MRLATEFGRSSKNPPLISLHNFLRPTAKSRQTRPNGPKRIKPNEMALSQSIDYACNFFDPVSNLLKRVTKEQRSPPLGYSWTDEWGYR